MRRIIPLRATLLLCGFFISAAAKSQSPVEGIATLPTTLSKEQLQSLEPLSARAIAEAQQRAAIAPHGQEPCQCPYATAQELSARRARMVREQAERLRADRKHMVRIHLLNRTDLSGQILSVGDDSFVIRARDGQKEMTIPYAGVSWMETDPTRGEKFRRGLGMTAALTVTSPLWVPWLALMWAVHPRE